MANTTPAYPQEATPSQGKKLLDQVREQDAKRLEATHSRNACRRCRTPYGQSHTSGALNAHERQILHISTGENFVLPFENRGTRR
jgi:hypothetical protein